MDAPELCRQLVLEAAERHRKGEWTEAERLSRQALQSDPENFSALHLLGVIYGATGRPKEALGLIGAALKVNPDSAPAALNYGLTLEALGREPEALAAYERAAARRPGFAAAHYNRANLLAASRPGEALIAYDSALAADPAHVEALGNRAGLLRALGRSEEALADYARALQLRPGDPVLSRNRGQLLRQIHQPQQALESYDLAITARPDWAEAWDDRGSTLLQLGRNQEALADFSRAIALDPEFTAAQLHKAVTLLLLGRLKEGWPLLEGRHRLAIAPVRIFPQPRWTGREDIKGKRLFIWWEEGLGDAIMFFRYALLARARGAHVIMSAPGPLLRLLGDAKSDLELSADIELIGPDETPGNFDFHIPLLSLPLAFGTTTQSIPAPTPYLRAESERVRKWADRIGGPGGDHGFRIGIVWATTASRSLGRSFPLAALKQISAIPGVRLISLQKEDGIGELAQLPPGMNVEVLGPLDAGDDGFLDSAAVMENLDLVISADTAIAHLAGALGRPVWVALQFAGDWRWFEDRVDSPWYAGMRLFRQERAGDWAGVFAGMCAALPAMLRRAAGPSRA